ncbi:MAG: M20/M25/M40 family metallo-hydrolase [Acidobacteriota bacterium]
MPALQSSRHRVSIVPRFVGRLCAVACFSFLMAFAASVAAETASEEATETSARSSVLDVAGQRVAADVAWLADDAREGRGIGTQGLVDATEWLARRFAALGLEPGGEDGGYLDGFDVPVRAAVRAGTELTLDGALVDAELFTVAAFSASGSVEADVVPVGYGITAPELTHDDYAEIDVEGKIVAVRRFVPPGARFDDAEAERRYGDLRYKAFNAREHGAIGVVIVDLPIIAADETMADEAVLPDLRVDSKGDAGLPVVVMKRDAGSGLFDYVPPRQPAAAEGEVAEGEMAEVETTEAETTEAAPAPRMRLTVELEIENERAHNVVGFVPAGAAERLDGALLVGAHFDHLGFGDTGGSLDPDSGLPHNGADDNASGTAALLEIARQLMAQRGELQRPVWILAFSGEESGLVGSTTFVRAPTGGLAVDELIAMVNLDMVGRLREDRVSVLGSDSSTAWSELLEPLCAARRLECKVGGDGYGPSDQTPFYAAGVPVVHWFTGTHEDYHRPSDDADKVNAFGTARIAHAVADLALGVAARVDGMPYVEAEAPAPGGDMRSFGASLGTIPDYVGDDRAGVLLAGARPGSAADRAGIQKGDLLVGLAGREIRDIYDFVFVLRSAKPGETAGAVVLRGDERLELEVTFDESSR